MARWLMAFSYKRFNTFKLFLKNKSRFKYYMSNSIIIKEHTDQKIYKGNVAAVIAW